MTSLALVLSVTSLMATPANKSALKHYYERFLSEDLNRCTTCHLPSEKKNPESLDEFPHNSFGHRLRLLGEELASNGKAKSLALRLKAVAEEDSDGDGVPNQTEILLGHNPGDALDKPTSREIKQLAAKESEFDRFLASYRWEPFQSVRPPEIPQIRNAGWIRNEIDNFIAAEHETRGLRPRPEASKEVLMRRASLDLIGLSPSPEDRRAFLADNSSGAYERLVDRLLEDPRYGERWGRHWMDVWRYSDWAGWSGGNQIRDSKPHIWRWRDWIIESLNADKPYDRMIQEMLAADELAPEDTNAHRATGFLVRNYKMLSREQWLEDTVKHTSQAFLGITMGCAKCHDHRTDPITQDEYYQLRAVFEPHQVRTDRLPGELDTTKAGLVRVYDVSSNTPTYFFVRGDERHPDTNRVLQPGVPKSLCWDGCSSRLVPGTISLPKSAAFPDRRDFVIKETLAESTHAFEEAQKALETAKKNGPQEKLAEAELAFALADAKNENLVTVLRLEAPGNSDSEKDQLANAASALQKRAAVLEAKLKLHQAKMAEHALDPKAKQKEIDAAKRKREEAEKGLAEVEKKFETGGSDYKPRPEETFPLTSTGRRLAFARWVSDPRNPLTARVAVNHIWLRHFGRGIVTTPENFGANGNPPSHPELLDWLASEFMAQGWSMKKLHRLILTSSTYRMSSTPDSSDAQVDPDNIYLWRMPSRRIDAELVRDNLLSSADDLDPAIGGPDIDNNLGLTSKRRSVYLRIAAEKEVEFLKIFDGPAVTECYQRHPTVMPQQALALANSKIALAEARTLAAKLDDTQPDSEFISRAFEKILARDPKPEELKTCRDFLKREGDGKKARENLVLVLFNHNDFVTVR
ncbi:MAG TPA: DUF1553 domain-containing protein [Verrucomicrobiae bacterium]|nr:DUF1553 domain-containing protein [Verrucomicrobiae bacterium]